MADLDGVIAFCKVVGTTIGKSFGSVLFSLRGVSDGDANDAGAEKSADEIAYAAVGLVSRPRPADAAGHAEAVALRADDGLPVIALRDLRLAKARGALQPGSIGLVGYAGTFLAIDDAAGGTGSTTTIYAPFEHNGAGVPAKAHAVTIDTAPGNEAILLLHAAGHAILLTPTGEVVIKNAAGDAFLSISDDGIAISGDVKLTNNVLAGSTPAVKPLAVADPLIGFVQAAAPILSAVAAGINGLAPGTVTPPQLAALNAAAALYSGAAPLAQTTKVQGEPG